MNIAVSFRVCPNFQKCFFGPIPARLSAAVMFVFSGNPIAASSAFPEKIFVGVTISSRLRFFSFRKVPRAGSL